MTSLTFAVAGGLSVLASVASAKRANGEPLTMHSVLSIAKFAGACGVLDSMIGFQRSTQMNGGDEFVARVWRVEAARLGVTVAQLQSAV